MKSNTMHHICVQTNCYDQSIDFYTKVLQFEIIKETPNFHGRHYNTWLKLESFMIELQTPKAGEQFDAFSKNCEGIAHFCLYVEDIQQAYQRMKNHSEQIFLSKNGEDIYHVENGYLFKLKAPEGTIIEIRDTEGL